MVTAVPVVVAVMAATATAAAHSEFARPEGVGEVAKMSFGKHWFFSWSVK
jgi:hypothetical protein